MDTNEESEEFGLMQKLLAKMAGTSLVTDQHGGRAMVSKAPIPQITIPMDMGYKTASTHLLKKHKEQQSTVKVDRTFNVLPWAGAYAVQEVVKQIDALKGDHYEVMTPFGPMQVQSEDLQVPCSSEKGTTPVFWGMWEITMLGELKMWHRRKTGSHVLCFGLSIECKQKDKEKAEELMDEIAKEVDKCELYKGSCVSLQPDEDGDLIISSPPEVFPTPNTKPEDVILSAGLHNQVSAELFTPIIHREKLKELGAGGSRGVLLAGRPGTGKTMSARAATRLALDNGWSAFYLPDARAIEAALAIASAHSPAVLICEDLDRQLSGKRTSSIDRVLNALDGLDKSKEVLFIATTNDDSDLPAPLLRPGRLHSLINFDVPDKKAAGRLLKMYLGKKAPKDITEAAEACAGLLPASIEEVAKRSILHAVTFGRPQPSDADLTNAAYGVQQHQRRLEQAEAKSRPERPSFDVHVHGETGDKMEENAVTTAVPCLDVLDGMSIGEGISGI